MEATDASPFEKKIVDVGKNPDGWFMVIAPPIGMAVEGVNANVTLTNLPAMRSSPAIVSDTAVG